MRSFAYPSILRGARTVMSEHDAFDRVLAAVHAATLDETRWPATSALIDEACGLTGNGLMVGEGPKNDVRALFVGLYYRGQRRDDLEREYLTTYYPIDERVPRFRHLPARRLVHITDLYTAEELKTSRTYNEILRRAGMQDGLNVQLPGRVRVGLICWLNCWLIGYPRRGLSLWSRRVFLNLKEAAGGRGKSGVRSGRGTMRGGGKGNGFGIESRARQGGTGARR